VGTLALYVLHPKARHNVGTVSDAALEAVAVLQWGAGPMALMLCRWLDVT
jgi:hypothetical protein